MSQHSDIIRCSWADRSPLETIYHDTEWGRPLFNSLRLFEKINLEAMQAGLSWTTVLNKRENFRTAFDGFNPEKIALYGEDKRNQLLNDAGIIRNRLKIDAVINNAKAYLEMENGGETFRNFFWKYVDFTPVKNSWEKIEDEPAFTETSTKISKELKKRGFKFVGPTTVYALMQSAGLVNDHLVGCFAWEEINSLELNLNE